jgi:hypothetical protein
VPSSDEPSRTERAGAPVAAYVLAVLTYIPLGVLTKTWFLNWIVGPLYLLAAVTVLTPLVDRLGLGRGRKV